MKLRLWSSGAELKKGRRSLEYQMLGDCVLVRPTEATASLTNRISKAHQ
jgi:hypothetical protein